MMYGCVITGLSFAVCVDIIYIHIYGIVIHMIVHESVYTADLYMNEIIIEIIMYIDAVFECPNCLCFPYIISGSI